jgi:hypothetical protein
VFDLETLNPPEEHPVPSGTVRLTHRLASLQVDPRSPASAVVLTEYKGYLDARGEFQDYGDPVRHEMDRQGMTDLLNSTEGGKPAGVFRTDDVIPAVARRRAELDAERAGGRGRDA